MLLEDGYIIKYPFWEYRVKAPAWAKVVLPWFDSAQLNSASATQ
jgi:hypothetical protein